MKLTEKQQEEMKNLKEEATKYIKENKSRTVEAYGTYNSRFLT